MWGLSAGAVRIASGDSQVGGNKAWITSEFAVTQVASFLILLLYAFFVAVAAGMSVIQDDENKVGALLHATPLTPTEYILGKFLGVMTAFTAILAIQVLGFGPVARWGRASWSLLRLWPCACTCTCSCGYGTVVRRRRLSPPALALRCRHALASRASGGSRPWSRRGIDAGAMGWHAV